jgi:peroxidase
LKFIVFLFKFIFRSVQDIDLYAGGLSEFVKSDLYVVGPTFSCLIMNQFSDLKKGDRFYYENGPEITASAFSLGINSFFM